MDLNGTASAFPTTFATLSDLLDSTLFAAVVDDRRFAVAAVIALVVILLLAVLASGWRYHGRPRLPATIGVGLLSGLASGAVQIAGPPVILYWLGGAAQAAFVRANLMVYFTFIDVIGCAAYF